MSLPGTEAAEAPVLEGDAFSADETALMERMEKGEPTEIPEKVEGDPEPVVAKNEGEPESPPKDESDDDEEVDEITIDASGKTRNPKGQFVSKSAFLRVKEQRKADRDALAQTREQMARGEERLKTLMDIINAQPEDKGGQEEKNPLEEPDIDETQDPLGALKQQKARTAYLAKQLQATSKQTAEQRQAMEARERELAIVSSYKADANRFYQKEPAFKDAWAHVLATRHAMLEAVGVADKPERDRIIAEEERGVVMASMKNKQSPAEAIWKMALALGFKKPEPNGGQQLSPAAKKLAEVQRAQEASKSLSQGGGGAPAEGITLESIADMSDDQFAAFAETVAGRKKLQEYGFM